MNFLQKMWQKNRISWIHLDLTSMIEHKTDERKIKKEILNIPDYFWSSTSGKKALVALCERHYLSTVLHLLRERKTELHFSIKNCLILNGVNKEYFNYLKENKEWLESIQGKSVEKYPESLELSGRKTKDDDDYSYHYQVFMKANILRDWVMDEKEKIHNSMPKEFSGVERQDFIDLIVKPLFDKENANNDAYVSALAPELLESRVVYALDVERLSFPLKQAIIHHALEAWNYDNHAYFMKIIVNFWECASPCRKEAFIKEGFTSLKDLREVDNEKESFMNDKEQSFLYVVGKTIPLDELQEKIKSELGIEYCWLALLNRDWKTVDALIEPVLFKKGIETPIVAGVDLCELMVGQHAIQFDEDGENWHHLFDRMLAELPDEKEKLLKEIIKRQEELGLKYSDRKSLQQLHDVYLKHQIINQNPPKKAFPMDFGRF